MPAAVCVKLVVHPRTRVKGKGGLRLRPVEKLIVRGSESEFYCKAFRRVARRHIAVSYGAEKAENEWGGGSKMNKKVDSGKRRRPHYRSP